MTARSVARWCRRTLRRERAGNAVNDFDLPSYTVPMPSPLTTPKSKAEGQFQLNVKTCSPRTYYTSSASRFFVSMGDSRQVSLSSTLEFEVAAKDRSLRQLLQGMHSKCRAAEAAIF